ncbi:MAG: protein phosphatase CheZ [Methylophilaceae bacterium]
MNKNNMSIADAALVNLSEAINNEEDMLHRIGQMTRGLHDSLRELGLDKMIEKAAHDIPDARDRLSYVATMTEQAANRVLNATDIATPLQDAIVSQATSLETRWQEVLKTSPQPECKEMAEATLIFLKQTVENANTTKAQLMEIMMAQDFQDLTGQVIKKITALAHTIEQDLVRTLVDFAPNKPVPVLEKNDGLLNGPQIAPQDSVNAVSNQEQVDDLLDSLGF